MQQKRFLANELRDLKVEEVSLVPKGANRKRFLLLKSALGGDCMYDESVVDRILNTDLENEDEIEQILKAQGLSEKAANAVKGALRLLNAYRDELPGDILNTLASLAGYGYQPPPLPASDEVKAARSQPKNEYGDYGEYGGYGDYGEGKGRKKPPKRATAQAEERAQRHQVVHKSLLGLARNRSEVWEAIEKAAEIVFGDSSPQSVDALLCTPTGAQLYSAYLQARVDPVPEPQPVRKAWDDEDVPAWQEIKRLANQQVAKADGSISEAEAVARALNTPMGRKPYKEYLRQKQELTARRR